MEEIIQIEGARENNLQDISIDIPRNKLVVITGLSGSGKSSLAFDTIYAEGQRRYIETFSAYARQFLGGMERPDVDKIDGLSPVISIEQKTVSKNPRSTVGTITEIYDFMRLLFARASTAFSYETGEKMVRYSDKQIVDLILEKYEGEKIVFLAPVVKGRKGHYRELFEQIAKQGFVKVRSDGEVKDITPSMRLDRYKVHDIEIVVDRLKVTPENKQRIALAVTKSMQQGKGTLMVMLHESEETKHFSRFLMCPTSGIAYAEPEPNLFSFNSPYGACKKCNGLGEVAEIDIKKIIPNPDKPIRSGAIAPLGEYKSNWIYNQVEAILRHHSHKLTDKISDLDEQLVNTILYGSDEMIDMGDSVGVSSYSVKFEGVISFIERQAEETTSAPLLRWAHSFMNKVTCSECEGKRLKKEAFYFKIGEKNIAELASMDIKDLSDWFIGADKHFGKKELTIAREPLKEIRNRLQFLVDVGLTYLSLNRSSKTLSGGEAQRIRLATQIGSELVNVLYILDEPSIGLHQRDNFRLINSLKKLRDIGNSVIVVEHDKDMMLASDQVIDIGPGAGIHGGKVVAQGRHDELESQGSITALYLNGKKEIEIPKKRRKGNGKYLTLTKASGNNLKDVSVKFPLGKLICVTGVSGSGKSTLINGTLYPLLNAHIYKGVKKPHAYKSIKGLEHLDKVIEIDQSPIGRTPRSNPATYTGIFAEIRNIFSVIPEAKIRGYKPGRFSFNVKG
ncbi:MAG TPA: excinuclease ABC subunit A, partial [Flavobacteriales bacterium]|nr:excinuclease ABC subunit A [Flavobacteriales bacterium]